MHTAGAQLPIGRSILGPACLLAALTLLSLTSPQGVHIGGQAAESGLSAAAAGKLARAPLGFVANRGEFDASTRYYARAPGCGCTFFFARDRLVMSLRRGDRGVSLELRFAGANPAAHPVLRGRTRAVNYLVGAQAGRRPGRTGTAVAYRDLWPGIDLVFRGSAGKLKYDLVVHPGADPRDISLAYAGADGLRRSPAGALLIDTPLGMLRDAAPRAAQVAGGRNLEVASAYRLRGSNVGFAVGAYDARRMLVIDPGLEYATMLGGSGDDQALDVDVDRNGNAYVAGSTFLGGFPTTPGAYDTDPGDGRVGYVAKFNADGTGLEYSTFIGAGDSLDEISGIAVDHRGNAVVTGFTYSPNFPTTPSAYDPSFNGSIDAFVAKLDARGSRLLYSTYLGGSSYEGMTAIALDKHDAAYMAGSTHSNDFPSTPGAFATPPQDGDVVLVKLNRTGSRLEYVSRLGSPAFVEEAYAVAVDERGSAAITGRSPDATFPVTPGAYDTSYGGQEDAFVSRLSPNGSRLEYSTWIGGSDFEVGTGLGFDRRGSLFASGVTRSPDFPTTPGAFDTTYSGFGSDVFVLKLDRKGRRLEYSTLIGNGSTAAGGMDVDRDGFAYLVGTSSAGFPVTPDAVTSAGDGPDAFVTVVRPDGAGLRYSSLLGGPNLDRGDGVAVDHTGAAYVAGNTDGDFPTTEGAFDREGTYDAFLAKIGLSP